MTEVLNIPKGINVVMGGDLKVKGTGPLTPRNRIVQETLISYPIQLTDVRVWDAIQTVLPGTAATDDLAISGGTFATNVHYLTAGDLKAAGATTRYGRVMVSIPAEYDSGQTILIRSSAGMGTTVSDTTCTLDVEVYKSERDSTITGVDLISTAATTMNSLTFADLDFTLDGASLNPGDIIDVRVAVACNDAATGTVVEPILGSLELVCDIRG